jgi:hypothetical protein
MTKFGAKLKIQIKRNHRTLLILHDKEPNNYHPRSKVIVRHLKKIKWSLKTLCFHTFNFIKKMAK